MKSILTITLALLSMNLFAGVTGGGDSTSSEEVIETVSSQICAEDVVAELGVSGSADISFTVDAEGYVHVEQIQSNDFLLEYHVRRALEGMKLSVTESVVGKTFSFIMNVVQQD